MHSYQQDFLRASLAADALCFGEFTLKSGRTSPYFFNAGKLSSGQALATLGKCYAAKIVEAKIDFDMLFGPAYKGIPLAAVTAASLATDFGINVPVAYNRKEAKDHGEGGTLVGALLAGRVLIIDDVITAGTAIREVMALLSAHGAEAAGVVIGLDRKERGPEDISAIASFEREFSVGAHSIITIEHLLEYLSNNQSDQPDREATLAAVQKYWNEYGAS